MSELLVSCHKCQAQVEVIHTRIVMADKKGRIAPVHKERVWRMNGVRPYQWVRLCLACNQAREESS
jgi:hypothetical protein